LVGRYTGKIRIWSQMRLEKAPKSQLRTRSAIFWSAPLERLLGARPKKAIHLGSSFHRPKAVGAAERSPNKQNLKRPHTEGMFGLCPT
jgi:hypothetical protein